MEGQAVKPHFLAKELEGPGCAVSRIAHHRMTRKPGVAPDLVLAAGQKVAFNKGVMGASARTRKRVSDGLPWPGPPG